MNIYEASQPDPNAPSTLGWRVWRWNDDYLVSPVMETIWREPELRIELAWNDSTAVRDKPGIHALRMPMDWKKGFWHLAIPRKDRYISPVDSTLVFGKVERFGRYTLGEKGWRAEHVIIHELQCIGEDRQKEIIKVYPDIPISHISPEEFHKRLSLLHRMGDYDAANRIQNRRPNSPIKTSNTGSRA
jgi:hypothetical protein